MKKFWVVNLLVGIIVLSTFGVINIAKSQYASGELEAIFGGPKDNKNVCIMFNVYWGTEYIKPILDILEANNIHTTFFIGGCWASQNEDVLKEIVEHGHEIGNHGFYHKDHGKISKERNRQEIEITHKLIEQVTQIQMDLFAPPSGSYNNTTLEVASQLGYRTIMWTKDTIDWRDKDANLVYNRATKNICGGDLILAHPTKHTTQALPKIIDSIINRGYNLDTVSNTIDSMSQ